MVIKTGARAKVELGCGKRPFDPEYWLVDHRNMGLATTRFIEADLDCTPWFWAQDDSCSFILAHQTLEHLHNLIPVMNEIYRIADGDAYVEIIVPHYKAEGAFADPTHVRFFTPSTFNYWEPRAVTDWSDYGIEGSFAVCVRKYDETGNIYWLLRPLKSAWDRDEYDRLKAQGDVRWPAPAELAWRWRNHKFVSDEPQ